MSSLEDYLRNIDRKYIQVLKFTNDVFKHARPQVPLKKVFEYLINSYPLDNLSLYQKSGASYYLVKPTGLLDNETSKEVLNAIYECLDDEQLGINFADEDMKPFKNFYFMFSDAEKLYEHVSGESPKVEISNSAVSTPNENITSFLGRHQKRLITYKLFTHEQIVCFMTDQNPACISYNDEFHAYWDMVQNALDSESLLPINEKEQIPVDQVKQWLSECGFIYIGFNESLPDSLDKTGIVMGTPSIQSLPPDSDQVAGLKRQLTDAQENGAKKQARIEELKLLLEQCNADQDDDEKLLQPNSQMSVARMLYAILTEHQYDLSAPKGKTNDAIVKASEVHGTGVSRNFVAKWIDLANQAKSDSTK